MVDVAITKPWTIPTWIWFNFWVGFEKCASTGLLNDQVPVYGQMM